MGCKPYCRPPDGTSHGISSRMFAIPEDIPWDVPWDFLWKYTIPRNIRMFEVLWTSHGIFYTLVPIPFVGHPMGHRTYRILYMYGLIHETSQATLASLTSYWTSHGMSFSNFDMGHPMGYPLGYITRHGHLNGCMTCYGIFYGTSHGMCDILWAIARGVPWD